MFAFPSRRLLVLVLVIIVPQLLLGCAGGPPAAGLLNDLQRFERDIQALKPSSEAAALLQAGLEKRETGRALLEKGKDDEASRLFEESLADLKAALAAAQAGAASREEDECLRAASRAQEGWQEAMNLLVQTEQVARVAASGVPQNTRSTADLRMPSFPPGLLDRLTTHELDAIQVRQAWDTWKDEATALSTPSADLEPDFEKHLAAAAKAKAGSAEYGRHLLLALRTTQTLEARVRATSSHRLCAEAASLSNQLGADRDAALRATLEIERGLKADLRAQLENIRAEAKTRQQELNEALKQIEGKFARITQEARGTIVSLADILFDFDKSTLKRDVEFNLVRVATILNQFPEMFIAVEGHTDNVGTEEYNLDLSKRRAQSVYEFLVSQGVAAERMTVEGFGMSRPVEDNSTDEGRQRNRRVDLVIRERP